MLAKMKNCLKSKAEEQKNEIIISVVGLDEAGKTTVVKVIKGDNDIKDLSPSVGFEPHELTYNSKALVLYDLGGGARVRDIWRHYLADSYGFIFVVDCSNRTRVLECSKVFSNFIENEKVSGKPILILGNKQDKPNAMDESEIVQFLGVEEQANRFQTPCRIETVIANSGTGGKLDPDLKIGFDWLFKAILNNFDELKTRVEHDTQLQKSIESRLKRERSEKVRQKRETEYPDYDRDDDDDKNMGNPWKSLNDLKQRDVKSKSSSDSGKMSSYDRQPIDDLRGTSPRPRLTTIDEERSKLRNKLMLRNNKLSPYDDGSDLDANSRSRDKSWAVTDNSYSIGTKRTSASFERSSRRFED